MTNRYIDRKFKETQSMNPLVKCGFKCCHCCLFCLEKCMRYISRNAYILVINRGMNFFSASTTSFSLLLSNLATVTTLKSVSTLFIWIGKIANCVLYGLDLASDLQHRSLRRFYDHELPELALSSSYLDREPRSDQSLSELHH